MTRWNYLVTIKVQGPDPKRGPDLNTSLELETWQPGDGFAEALDAVVKKANAAARALDEAAGAHPEDRSANEEGPEPEKP
jgi:hypothetical protein